MGGFRDMPGFRREDSGMRGGFRGRGASLCWEGRIGILRTTEHWDKEIQPRFSCQYMRPLKLLTHRGTLGASTEKWSPGIYCLLVLISFSLSLSFIMPFHHHFVCHFLIWHFKSDTQNKYSRFTSKEYRKHIKKTLKSRSKVDNIS